MKKIIFGTLLCTFVFCSFAQSFEQGGGYRSPFEGGWYRSPFDQGVIDTPSTSDDGESGDGATTYTNSGGGVEKHIAGAFGWQNYFCPESANSNLASFALDTQFVWGNGFMIQFNNALGFGTAKYAQQESYYGGYTEETGFAVQWAMDFLLGYRKAFGQHAIGFGAGFELGSGLPFIFEGGLDLRLDYSYAFNAKSAVQVSLNEMIGGCLGDACEGFTNGFGLKVGYLYHIN